MGNCLETSDKRASLGNHVSPNNKNSNSNSFTSNEFNQQHLNSSGGKMKRNFSANNHIINSNNNTQHNNIPDLMTGDIPITPRQLSCVMGSSNSTHMSSHEYPLQNNSQLLNNVSQMGESHPNFFSQRFIQQQASTLASSVPTKGPGDQKIVICLDDFSAKSEKELSFRKGDYLIVLDETGPDWYMAEHTTTNRTGFVPKDFVTTEFIEIEDWFFPKTMRRDAEKLLMSHDFCSGTFLIRNSEQTNTGYSLSIRDRDSQKGDVVKHYKIKTLDNGGFYVTTKKKFANMKELIDFYSQGPNGLCHKLVMPCPKPKLSFWPDREAEITRTDLQYIRKIGTGFFGEVYYGKYRNDTEVAIKTLKQGKMSPQAFLDEAIIMRKCRHPKLVPCYGVCSQEEPLLIITEYMCNGSLLDYLRSNREGKNLKLLELMDMASQICSGMAYLEQQKLIHRDLAARNILVGKDRIVKVADFGLARVIEDTEYTARQGAKFPIKWTAPEAAMYGKFSIKSDVWS